MARAPLGRQRLLRAARAELLASGGRLDVNSVVRRAGLTSGALYHHFGSKAGLLAAVCGAFYDSLDATIADDHLGEAAEWAQREQRRLRRMVAYLHEDQLAALLLTGPCPDPRLAELKTLYIQRTSEAAARNIRRGQRLGQLSSAIHAESAGAYIVGGLGNAIAQQLTESPRPSLDEAAERLWMLVAGTLQIF